jgi:hypothetical protein
VRVAAFSDLTVDDTYTDVPFFVDDTGISAPQAQPDTTTPIQPQAGPAPLQYAPIGTIVLILGIVVWCRGQYFLKKITRYRFFIPDLIPQYGWSDYSTVFWYTVLAKRWVLVLRGSYYRSREVPVVSEGLTIPFMAEPCCLKRPRYTEISLCPLQELPVSLFFAFLSSPLFPVVRRFWIGE